MTDSSPHSWRRDLALLFCAVALFFCLGLGARPYVTPSEARYIEIPRQMLATGDWLTPRIDGVPYFEKPPLFYWMQASVMQFFGTGEFAGRIVTAILSVLLCLVTYATARMLYGRLSGWLAAGVLATSGLVYGLSRAAMLDVPVSLFLTCTMACFLAAQKERRFYLLMYASAALAVMSKGLIGIVVPGLVIGAWIMITKRWRILAEARLLTGLFIVMAIAAPWHVLMMREHPAFFDFYFIHEHFTRYLTDSHKRVQPWWFFIAVLPAGLLPWTFIIPLFPAKAGIHGALKADPRFRGEYIFLLLWIALPLLFFSASHSKLVPYILPVFPPIAIMLGRYLAEVWEGRADVKTLRRAALVMVALFTAALLVYFGMPPMPDDDRKIDLGSISFETLLPVILALVGLGYVILSRRAAPILIGALAMFGAVTEVTANYASAGLDRASVKPLIPLISARLRPDDMVVAYGTYFQDLPVYLHRNVTIAGYVGELEFGYLHYPQTHALMPTIPEFWRRCADAKQVYVFMKKSSFDEIALPPSCRLRLLGSYGKTVLLEKEPQ